MKEDLVQLMNDYVKLIYNTDRRIKNAAEAKHYGTAARLMDDKKIYSEILSDLRRIVTEKR